LNGLPRFYHPMMNYSSFEGITDDRFVLVIEAGDRDFDAAAVKSFLEAHGADKTELVEE